MIKEEIIENGNRAFIREVSDGGKANVFVVGYIACANEYEKQIAVDAERIRTLQETNGSLTDRVNRLEQRLEQTEKDLSDYQFNYPTIKELQKENAELKNRDCWKSCEYANPKAELIGQHIKDVQNLAKAKDLLAKWVELYNPKLEGFPKTPIQEETERFLTENK